MFDFLCSGRHGVVGRNPQPRVGRLLDSMILKVNIPLHSPEGILRSISDLLFDELKATKIYSLTKRSNHMGMWAKYADDHCGYCLEFANEGDFFGQAKEVVYTDTIELDVTKQEQIGGWFFFCKTTGATKKRLEFTAHVTVHTK